MPGCSNFTASCWRAYQGGAPGTAGRGIKALVTGNRSSYSRGMPHTRLFFVILFLTLLSLPVRAEKLRIVSDPWPPYAYVENGQTKGIDYEVTAAVFKRLGIEVQWEFMPWKRCLAMIAQGQADGIIDVFHTPMRDAELVYSAEPFSNIEYMLFQNDAHPHRFEKLGDLAGLTIGTSAGYFYGQKFMDSDVFKHEAGPTHEANFGKLVRGRIDLVITDRRVGMYVIHQMGLENQVSQLPIAVYQQPQYFAMRRNAGMDLLVQRFSAELKRFKAEPRYREMSARYAQGDDHSRPAPGIRDSVHPAVEQHEGGAM